MTGRRDSLQPVTYRVHGLAGRRQDAERGQGPSVHDNLAVDKNFVFTVATMFGVDLDLQLSSQPRRHTDGVKSGNSISTIANNHSGHMIVLTHYSSRLMGISLPPLSSRELLAPSLGPL